MPACISLSFMLMSTEGILLPGISVEMEIKMPHAIAGAKYFKGICTGLLCADNIFILIST